MKVALLSRHAPANQFVVDLLSRGGIEAMLNVSIASFRLHARARPFDAVVLQDCGYTLVEDLSLIKGCVDQEVPVVVVGEEMRAGFGTALACGAADYIHLSRAAHDELPVRLRGHVEAQGRQGRRTLKVGACLLDAGRMRAACGSESVELTHREFELAWLLFSRADQLVTNATIAARVWGRSVDLNKRTLEQHVYKLRAKLARLGSELRVHAVYGRGYQLLTGQVAPLPAGEEPTALGAAAEPAALPAVAESVALPAAAESAGGPPAARFATVAPPSRWAIPWPASVPVQRVTFTP
jgi:DNA-binding response OmpR family regulator